MKKIRISSELVYVLGTLILSFATAMMTAANLGLSMVIAPAYILSLKISFLSFGQAEYIVQGMLFIVFCGVVKKIKPFYLWSFLSGLIYGIALDVWRIIIPHFNPTIYKPGEFPVQIRLLYFGIGFLLNSFAVMLYFKSYFYPQVYEFFVKGISIHFQIELSKVKIGFDITCLIVALILSMVLLGQIEGIGPGTIVLACCNGLLIGWYGRMFDRYAEVYPKWKTLSKKFEF